MGLPVFMLMIAIGVLGESQEVKAANKLKVVVKKSTLVKLTDYRNIKVKVYFNGKDVKDDAKIKYKNSNKKAVKIYRSDDFVGFEVHPKKWEKARLQLQQNIAQQMNIQRKKHGMNILMNILTIMKHMKS